MEEAKKGIHGIKVSRNALSISHLMYTDDILVMCRARGIKGEKLLRKNIVGGPGGKLAQIY